MRALPHLIIGIDFCFLMIPIGLHIGYDGKLLKKKEEAKHSENQWGAILVYFEDNNRPDLTSHWHPQVKLNGRGPAGVSLALH
jgi:hypothetical protein